MPSSTKKTSAKPSALKKVDGFIRQENEKGARFSIIEELFYDFHRAKSQVYWMNFVRGLFFGAGSVIGGTVVIALIAWLLSLLGNVIPPLGNFFDGIGNLLEAGRR